MDPISIEDLALLEVLHGVDQSVEINAGQTEMRQRLIESGLAVDDGEHGMKLTSAGIELCKSLQHRVAADAQAAKILEQQRETGIAGSTTANDSNRAAMS